MKIDEVDNIGGYYTIESCARALGLTDGAVRYRVFRYGVPVKRIGATQFVRLVDVRDVPLDNRGGVNRGKRKADTM